MKRTRPGDIWRVDLGLAAKVRPVLILSDYPLDDELALVIVVPHTTAIRRNRWEVSISKRFLTEGAFHIQQMRAVTLAALDTKIGELTPEEFSHVRSSIVRLLHLGD